MLWNTKSTQELLFKKTSLHLRNSWRCLVLPMTGIREINTTDTSYYKWTQWIFLKMFEKGLAYESEEPVHWCPQCKTVLALEDLEKGRCERCGTLVIQKKTAPVGFKNDCLCRQIALRSR